MTHGRHVTAAECREMRDLHERGYFVELIAEKIGVSKSAAEYHIYDRCDHVHDE